MRIGLIQTKQNRLYNFIEREEHLTAEEAKKLQDEMIEQNLSLIREAKDLNVNVIVTSEAINFPGQPEKIEGDYKGLVPTKEDNFFRILSEEAKSANAYLIAGVYYREGSKLYNGAFVYGPDGDLRGIYQKIHLAGSENDYLTPGEDYLTIDTEYGRLGVLICYDMQFPEAVRELVLRGADIVLCPTWGWEQIYGHARAYENGIYAASAMAIPYWMDIEGLRNPSEVISPVGEILVRGSYTKTGVIICDLNPYDCKEMRESRIRERHPNTYLRIAAEKGAYNE